MAFRPADYFFRVRSGSLRGRGLTLMELLIGLAITAVISAVLAVLMNSTAMGTSSQQDGRRSLVKMQSIKAQVGDGLSSARCILDVGTNYIVYWIGDQPGAPTPADNAVDLSELRLLEVDTATGNLNLYAVQWPAKFTSTDIVSADTIYPANTAWHAAATAAKSGGYFVPTTVAINVAGMAASLDSSSATASKLINVVITINDSVASRPVIASAQLTNYGTPW